MLVHVSTEQGSMQLMVQLDTAGLAADARLLGVSSINDMSESWFWCRIALLP